MDNLFIWLLGYWVIGLFGYLVIGLVGYWCIVYWVIGLLFIGLLCYSVIGWSLGVSGVSLGGLWGSLGVCGVSLGCLWDVSGGSLEDPGLEAGGPTLRCRNHCNLHGFSSRYDVSRRRNAPEVKNVW